MKKLYSFTFILMVITIVSARLKVIHNHEVSHHKGSWLKHLIRVKRDWSYPDIEIDEHLTGAPFNRKKIATIKSDSPSVARYEIADTQSPDPASQSSGPVAQGLFSIENDGKEGGKLFQEKPVDREEAAKYVITAKALNSAGQPVESDVNLNIIVEDENDNSPIFVQDTLQGSVPENTKAGFEFMQVRATDADSSDKDYGVVRYKYNGKESPPSESARFAVSEYGFVSVIGYLDRESVGTIRFEVLALDGSPYGGATRHTTAANVTVTITDTNDHAPQFTASNYDQSVGESLPVQSTIVTVATTDDDEGVNKASSFKITGGDPDGHFSMRSNPSADPNTDSTGDLVLEKPLDFESGVTVYNVDVTAYNKDSENPDDPSFQSTITVTVRVTDQNEPPVFVKQPYTGSVRENQEGPINNVATVEAVDYDFGGTQIMSYSINENENPEGWFEISSLGVVSAVKPVDREHYSVNKTTSVYLLHVVASDNDPDYPMSNTAEVSITIGDVNDNAPRPSSGWDAIICEYPDEGMKRNVTQINVIDPDSALNGPPFKIEMDDTNDWPFFLEELTSANGALVQTLQQQFTATVDPYKIPITLEDSPTSNEPSLSSTHTLTISVCRCDKEGNPDCNTAVPVAAGFPVAVLIAIIAAILILLIIVLAVVAYRRRNKAELDKQALFYDEDDVRENLQAYHDEGGGEEDNDGYDITALQAPPLIAPKRQDEPPLGGAQPQPRSRIPPDTGIEDYINDAKQQADNDPTAPPFDSLLVFDYEGGGSDAGSLSSLNSGTTDASQDYDYLNNWGPRFKKLADMYGGGESD